MAPPFSLNILQWVSRIDYYYLLWISVIILVHESRYLHLWLYMNLLVLGIFKCHCRSWMASLNCLETLKVEQWASSYTRDCGSFIKSDDMTKTLDSLWQCMIRGDKGTCCQNSTGSSVPARTCCSATYEASQKGVTEALFAGYGAIQRLFCSEHCIRTPWTVFETSTLWLVSRPLARSWQDSYAERWWCYVEFFIILFLFFLFLLLRFLSLLLI